MHTLTKTSLLSIMVIPNSVAVTYRDAAPFKEALSFLLTSFSPLQGKKYFLQSCFETGTFPISSQPKTTFYKETFGISIFKETFHSSHAQLCFIVLPSVPSVAYCIDIISLLCVCFIVSCMSALRLQEGEELGSHHQELSIGTLSTVWHKLSVCRNTRVNKSCFARLLKLIN